MKGVLWLGAGGGDVVSGNGRRVGKEGGGLLGEGVLQKQERKRKSGLAEVAQVSKKKLSKHREKEKKKGGVGKV